MRIFTRLAPMTATLVTLSTLPAFASDCDEGFYYDEVTLTCQAGDGSGDTGGGSGSGDDGTEPRLLRFLTPAEGTEFSVGTAITALGRTSINLVQNLPLDLTVILDRSASMQLPTPILNEETVDPTDYYTRFDLVTRAFQAIADIFPEDGQLTLVDFASDVHATSTKIIDANGNGVIDFSDGTYGPPIGGGVPITPDLIADYVDGITADGATNLGEALQTAVDIANDSVLFGYEGELYDREYLILTDGYPTGFVNPTLYNFLSAYGDLTGVALPGNTPGGAAYLQSMVETRGGGVFLDYSDDPMGFLDLFGADSARLIGLNGLQITDPLGNTYAAETDALGYFSLDPFNLLEGSNTFTATATFEDGSTMTDTLTLMGVAASAPAVPLPAAGWFLIAGLGGLGAVARRKKAA